MQHRPLVISMVFLLASVFGLAGRAGPPAGNSPGDDPKQTAQAPKTSPETDTSLYVGTEVCKTCHEDVPSKDFYKNYEASPHFATMMEGKLDAHKGPQWQGCEACHGPGKEHVEG